MLKVKVKILAQLKCPNHPRHNGSKSPQASCKPCQEISNLALKLRDAQANINLLLAQAIAIGCVDSSQAATLAGQNDPQSKTNER